LKIFINTASSYKGGGIQVAKSYIEEFKKFDDNIYFVMLSKNLASTLNLKNFPDNFQFFIAPFRPSTRYLSLKNHNGFLKKVEEKWKPDIVFSTGGPSYWRPKSLHIIGFTIPHYIYPESPYFDIISSKKKLYWKGMKLLAKYLFRKDADILVAQTDDVTKRVKKFLSKNNVHTVSNTINNHYVNSRIFKNKLPSKKTNEFRLLTISGWYPHKNIDIIPKVIDSLENKGVSNVKFITTLPKEDFNKLGPHENIFNVGRVKIEEGASLYQECDVMFLPTLLECFSASYAEAMIMKKPILTSNMGFAHTVCMDAALYFNPIDADDIANKIILLYNNKKLQESLVKKGLDRLNSFGSAEDRARHILEICKTTLKEPL